VRQLRDQPTEGDGDQGLDGEGGRDPDPHHQRAVAGREHQRGDEGLVRQFDREDQAKDDGGGDEAESHGEV